MFKKPSINQVVSAGVGVGGAVAGSMLSRVVVDAVAGDAATDVAGSSNKKLYASIGIVALSIVGIASVIGNDTTATALKGSFVGMAVTQGSEVIKHLSKDSIPADSTKMRVALGLGCACNDGMQSTALRHYNTTPRLSYPAMETYRQDPLLTSGSYSGMSSLSA